MAQKAGGKSKVAQAANYKTSRRWETNRKRKLEKTLKAQPNNQQVKDALKCIVYRRKAPKTREWSASWIATAKIFKQFTGRFDRDIMSSNVDIARAALQRQSPIAATYVPNFPTYAEKNFFSLQFRNNLRKA